LSGDFERRLRYGSSYKVSSDLIKFLPTSD